ncbi:MAG TPA: [protein-PII] uridylyltransferase [Desulfobacterales bacterium]
MHTDTMLHQITQHLKNQRLALIGALDRLDATAFMEQHSRIYDEYFRACFESSMVGPQLGIAKNPYVFIALGGYGREEQCLHSDIDVLFLFHKKVPEAAENLIREIIYPLWDVGLEVGYATRSLKECLSMATKDYEVLTPILDARFLCGMSPLYSELIEKLHAKILSRHSRKIIAWLVQRNRARHLQFGDSTYRLEPNLKEGKGGLRDYHTMLWLARIQYQLRQPRDLEFTGKLSHEEYRELGRALTFIWDVRNRLHRLCGRKCDQLHFENQIRLAESMNYRHTNGQQPVETFLSDLQGKMEFIKHHLLIFLAEMGYTPEGKPRKRRNRVATVEGLYVDREMLCFASPEAVLESPQLLIRIFEESLRLKLPLSAEAKRIVKEFAHRVEGRVAGDPETVASFERILAGAPPVVSVLREMLNTGILVQLIPPFDSIVNRIQYDEYHLYPVDKHLLRTVQTIKNLTGITENSQVEPLCVEIYKKLRRRNVLLWAALLHDIGKGGETEDHSESGAAIVRSLLQSKGMSPEDVDTVAFLVEKHLFLVKIATRRDIYDEETAIFCAREIGDPERLRMLYLLTVADCMATGPNAWNEWTATLLRELFLKTLNILEHGELASRKAVREADQKKTIVLAAVETEPDREAIASVFDVLSPRYLMYATPDQILEDIRRFLRLQQREFVWNITRTADSETRTVKVCAKDRPGLFSNIAGVFTLNNIDIVDAQIFTWRNRVAVDIFTVKPPPDRIFEEDRWNRTAAHLERALAGELDLKAALRQKISGHRRRIIVDHKRANRIIIDNHSSSFFTIIEVFTYDYPGLLFNVTDALFSCRLDIWVAKIATKVDQVVDVFYVRDFDGQKVDAADQVAEIKAAVEERLIKVPAIRTEPVMPY